MVSKRGSKRGNKGSSKRRKSQKKLSRPKSLRMFKSFFGRKEKNGNNWIRKKRLQQCDNCMTICSSNEIEKLKQEIEMLRKQNIVHLKRIALLTKHNNNQLFERDNSVGRWM
jgi:hypothetical protein